jgi:hypothetical protein
MYAPWKGAAFQAPAGTADLRRARIRPCRRLGLHRRVGHPSREAIRPLRAETGIVPFARAEPWLVGANAFPQSDDLGAQLLTA